MEEDEEKVREEEEENGGRYRYWPWLDPYCASSLSWKIYEKKESHKDERHVKYMMKEPEK